jgi:hypothetical protein
MRKSKRRRLSFSLIATALSASPLCAQQERSTYFEERTVSRPSAVSNTESIEEPSLGRPKYRQRIKDLGEQIHLVQSKGFISQDEATKFLDRQSKLFSMEAEARNNGFPKPATDDLEKAITLLNEEVFKASHKNNPIKPGQAEREVNDPNLIPAYPDKDLQPGSGQASTSKDK